MPLPISRFEKPAETGQPQAGRTEARYPTAVLGGQSIRDVLVELGRPPRKTLGQHFLAQPRIAQRMADLADVAEKRVVEVGPGLGVLTQFLLDASELWLVEIDRELAARLNDLLRDRSNVRIWNTDALTVPWSTFLPEHAPVSLVGNLPYHVATPLLERWLEVPHAIDRIVIMVQREVAERLRAQPGSHQYSALSVLTQAVARVRKGFSVAPGSFVPAPKVYSEVVVLEPDPALRQRVADFSSFRQVVRMLFQQRRKQLRNSLGQLTSNPSQVLQAASLDAHARPENLTVEDFFRLARALSAYARTS
ncbi:Ribosomal RNA small subunit methyltransferase A [bacterium HR30]|nr:Ribosomal RNA small subunit methyltransferase A [bacterium HR30]